MLGAGLLLLVPALAALSVVMADWVWRVDQRLLLTLFGGLALCQLTAAALVLRGVRRRDAAAREAAAASAEAIAARNALVHRQSEMLAIAAHEVRTPLGGVLGLLDLVLASPSLPPVARQDAGAARQAAGDLMLLLRDMIEAPADARPDELFRIDDLMEQVVALLRGRAAQQGTTLATAVAPGTPPAWIGDPLRLRQILTNLVANAIRFTVGGVVRIEAREGPARGLEVAVSDTGKGIAPERLAKMFDRFQPSEGGTGLGLSICRDLAARMGGTVTVNSAPGRGSLFSVALPLRQVPPAEVAGVHPAPARLTEVPARLTENPARLTQDPARLTEDPARLVQAPARLTQADARLAPAPAMPLPIGGLPVLVVDDVAANRRLLGVVLERAGHAHQGAASAVEALQMLAAGPYRAVLMDLQMPGMDGFEATRRIRALPGAAGSVPVLAVTAQDSLESRAAATASGMNGYLPKPVGLADLAAALRDLAPEG